MGGAATEAPVRRPLALTGWAVAGGLLRALGSIAAMAVLARTLGPEVFGLMGMLLPLLYFTGLFADGGMAVHLLQRRDLDAAELAAGFWVGAAGAALAAAGFALAAPAVARAYGEPALLAPALALAAWFPLQALRLQHDALARRRFRHDLVTRADLAETLGAPVLAAGLALAGAGVWALVGLVLARPALHAAAIWPLTGWVPGRPRVAAMRSVLGGGGRLLAADGALFVARALDRVALGWAHGAAALGPYHLAHQLVCTPLQQVQTPVAGVAIPWLAGLRDDRAAFSAALGRVAGGLAHALWPGLAVTAVAAGPLTAALLGPGWAEAAPIAAALAVAAAGMAVRGVTGWALTAEGRPGAALRWNLAAAVAVTAAVLAALGGGPVAVAGALAATECALVPAGILWLARTSRLDPWCLLGALLPPAVLAAAAAAAMAALLRAGAAAGASLAAAAAIVLAAAVVSAVVTLGAGRTRLRLRHG